VSAKKGAGRSLPDRCREVKVVAGELEGDAGLIGASLLARGEG